LGQGEHQQQGDRLRTELLHGVVAHLDTCDAVINRNLTNWKPDRLGHLERAILRLAVYEYLYLLEIPYEVSITEAVSLAKRFAIRTRTNS
jgi:N utilization substance protein B